MGFDELDLIYNKTTVKYLLCYLKETSNYKLIYKESNNLELLQTYSNTLHGGCKEISHFTGGYVIIVCGRAVRHGSHWDGSPQNGLGDEQTCRMILALAYMLCCLFAT